MNVLVFDIETIPDVESGKRLFDLDGLPTKDIARAMTQLQKQKTGTEFLPHHLQRLVAISVVLRTADSFKVWSLGREESTEAELLERFYEGIDRFNPTLVSWNGSGFDLPVIHYRSLMHGITAARYWETGNEDTSFRYNNYLSRFHWRHIDLMDVLAGYQPRGFAPLDQVATLLGFPGKLGMSGAGVWDTWLANDIAAIRDYCETDVLNTYLIYLRFELMRGQLDRNGYTSECRLVQQQLEAANKAHFSEFLKAWEKHAKQ